MWKDGLQQDTVYVQACKRVQSVNNVDFCQAINESEHRDKKHLSLICCVNLRINFLRIMFLFFYIVSRTLYILFWKTKVLTLENNINETVSFQDCY